MAMKIKRTPKIMGAVVLAIGAFFAVKTFVVPQLKGTAATASSAGSGMTPESSSAVVVRMTGSSTIGQALAPRMALAFLTKQGAADAKEADDKANEKTVVTGTVSGKTVSFEISYPGSGAAFECLNAQTCDIGMSSRPIQAQESKAPRAEHVLAMDGIAVIINPSNQVTTLTVSQIEGIFLGQTTSWSQVGGSTGTIHVFSRDKKSGTYDSFVHMALEGRDVPASRGPILMDNEAVTRSISSDPGAIGFVGLAFVGGTKALNVQNGTATPMAPSFFTVGTEDYAFSRRLYLYTDASPKSDLVKPFVDFSLSDEGQRVVSQVGFVSLNVSASEPTIPSAAPLTYVRATKGAKRLSFDFRFDFGGTTLDGKARADLTRMAAYIHSTRPSALALLGFADNVGSDAANLQVSKARAQAVANELKSLGVDVQSIDGFGSAMPVAPNDSAEGRNRNRRVEAWVL